MNALAPILELKDLTKDFPVRAGLFSRVKKWICAVRGVSFAIKRGETLGLVGESGCGKTTLARLIVRLLVPTGGTIVFDGADLLTLRSRDLKPIRRRMQLVFQDPYSSLDPRMRVGDILEEPLVIHRIGSGRERRERVDELLRQVGLPLEARLKYPHAFSGGQRQRIAVARALALHPDLIIADEPVSALDVSVQAQIINLFVELKKSLNLSYLFISHDLRVVRHISDWIAVMYLGRIVEVLPAERLLEPLHPYTQVLMSAIPGEKGKRRLIPQGDVPSPAQIPSGCAFHPRCPFAEKRCTMEDPPLKSYGERQAACHLLEGGV